jgi:hypothetical protein
MYANPRRTTSELPELEITFEEVLAATPQDPAGKRVTLELVRDIARVKGRLSKELFEQLKNHGVYAVLNDHDRSLVDAAFERNLMSPLKRLMFYMLKACCGNQARQKLGKGTGWSGMVARSTQMLARKFQELPDLATTVGRKGGRKMESI